MKPYFPQLMAAVLGAAPLTAVEVISDDFESGAFSDAWTQTQALVTLGEGAESTTNFAALGAHSTGEIIGRVIEGGASDLEIDAYIRVRDTGARQFNLLVFSSETVAVSGSAINLRYQGGSWSTFGSGSWRPLTGLGALTPELWHRIRVTCRGWGSAGASFDVQISDAEGNTFTSAETGIKFYQGGNPDAGLAGGVAFTSNWGGGSGFDVDEVTINTLEAVIDDPNISLVSGEPFLGAQVQADGDPISNEVTIENTGTANDLIIADSSAITGIDGGNFSILTDLPLTIAPGTTGIVEVQFDPMGDNGTFGASLDLASNDASNPVLSIPMSVFSLAANGNQLGNGDFEADNMGLPKWTRTSGQPIATAGFAPDSTIAASIPGGSDLELVVNGQADWYCDFYFQVQETGSRSVNFIITAAPITLNLQCLGTGEFALWQTFVEGEGYGGDHAIPGPIAGETYFMRVIGRDWGGAEPTYDLQISEPGSSVLAHEATGISRFRGAQGVPSRGPSQVNFSSVFGANPGFFVDDVSFFDGAAPPLGGEAGPLAISDYAYDAATSSVTFSWNAVIDGAYSIEQSTDLTDWEEVEDAIAAETTETITIEGLGEGPLFFRVLLLD